MKLGSWRFNVFNNARRSTALNAHSGNNNEEAIKGNQSLQELQMMAELLENEADAFAGDDIEKNSNNIMKFDAMEESDITDLQNEAQ